MVFTSYNTTSSESSVQCHNNTQLFTLITKYLADHLEDNQNEIVVTSDDPVPVAIRNGKVARRDELHNIQEEADVIIGQG